jgi:hypothetical protein
MADPVRVLDEAEWFRPANDGAEWFRDPDPEEVPVEQPVAMPIPAPPIHNPWRENRSRPFRFCGPSMALPAGNELTPPDGWNEQIVNEIVAGARDEPEDPGELRPELDPAIVSDADLIASLTRPPAETRPAKELYELNCQAISPEFERHIREVHESDQRPYADYKGQIRYVVDLLRNGDVGGYGRAAAVFGVARGTICNLYNKEKAKIVKGARPRGRPGILSPERLCAVRRFIVESFRVNRPAMYSQIADWLIQNFGVDMERDTMRKMLKRMNWCKTVKGVPMDANRVDCPRETIDQYFANLKANVNNCDVPADMLFNVDEIGFQEWADRMDVTVVVPSWYQKDEIEFPVDRSVKKISAIVCISASGDALKPLLVVSRKTIDGELRETGISDRNCTIVSQDHAFVNVNIFDIFHICPMEVLLHSQHDGSDAETVKKLFPCSFLLHLSPI